MADNLLLTSNIIVKESLRLLKNNLVMAKNVNRTYEKQFAKVGDTISVKQAYRTRTASGRVLVTQPMVDIKVPFKIEYQEHYGVQYTSEDLTLSIMDFSDRYLKSGMSQLANVIDSSIFSTLKQTFFMSGVPGTRPSKYIDFATASAKQTTYAVPEDGQRKAIVPPMVCALLSDEVTKLFNTKYTDEVYRKGYRGPVSNYDLYETQNIPSHTTGNFSGTPLIAGTIDNGSSITTDGWTASVTGLLKEGDVITIAGVYGINPQGYTTTGMLQEFVVTADVDSTAAGLATINISPSMNDGTATENNSDGDSVSTGAYQNVTALPADNAVITVAGNANTIYEQVFLFHKDALTFAMVDFELPRTAVIAERASDPDTGLSLSLTGAYDITQQTEIFRIDALWGVKAIFPELAMKMFGQALGTVVP